MENFMLQNLSADALKAPLRSFWRSELYDEMIALEGRLFPDITLQAEKPDIDENEWEDIMLDLLDQIPAEATEIAQVENLTLLPSPAASALHWRIRQALSLVGGVLLYDTPRDPPRGVLPSHEALLPMRLQDRLELVLGSAILPMVWVRSIDLASVDPAWETPERPD